jgi:hypothetical protein
MGDVARRSWGRNLAPRDRRRQFLSHSYMKAWSIFARTHHDGQRHGWILDRFNIFRGFVPFYYHWQYYSSSVT